MLWVENRCEEVPTTSRSFNIASKQQHMGGLPTILKDRDVPAISVKTEILVPLLAMLRAMDRNEDTMIQFRAEVYRATHLSGNVDDIRGASLFVSRSGMDYDQRCSN